MVGPEKVAPTARSSMSLLTTSLGGVGGWGRGSGLSLSFVCVMFDVPLDPMPEWSKSLKRIPCHSVLLAADQ